MITLLVTDADLQPIGDPIITWTSVSAESLHNEVGAGQFIAPATSALLAATTTPGARIRLIRDGAVFSSGPIEQPSAYTWSAGAGVGETTVTWADDLIVAARMVAYPNPALAATAQVIDAYVATATNAETIIRDIVNRNAGPGALTARRQPHLTIAPVAGIGTTIDASARFDQLGDLLRTLATAGGNLGIRIVESDGGLIFQVYAPQDRSDTVRFSPGLNNLRSLKLTHTAPAATVAIVGGSGTGASRIVVERANTGAAAWGRSETWVSSSATSTTELNQAGDAALAERGERFIVDAVAIDTPDQRFGTHFNLGDTVTLETPIGTTITDVVSGAKLTATPKDGDLVTVTIGSQRAAAGNQVTELLRQIERRLGARERG